MSRSPASGKGSRRRGCRGMLWPAAGFAAIASSASAQGINPGDPAKDAYTLPGGFEPVVQLRTYYFESDSLTGSQSAAWALGGWAGLRSPWWGDLFQVGNVGYSNYAVKF
jgi:hypothetical protein